MSSNPAIERAIAAIVLTRQIMSAYAARDTAQVRAADRVLHADPVLVRETYLFHRRINANLLPGTGHGDELTALVQREDAVAALAGLAEPETELAVRIWHDDMRDALAEGEEPEPASAEEWRAAVHHCAIMAVACGHAALGIEGFGAYLADFAAKVRQAYF